MPSASLSLISAFATTDKKCVRALQQFSQRATFTILIDHQAVAYLLTHRHSKPHLVLEPSLASLTRFCRAHHLDMVMHWGFLVVFVHSPPRLLKGSGRVIMFVGAVVACLSLILFIG